MTLSFHANIYQMVALQCYHMWKSPIMKMFVNSGNKCPFRRVTIMFLSIPNNPLVSCLEISWKWYYFFVLSLALSILLPEWRISGGVPRTQPPGCRRKADLSGSAGSRLWALRSHRRWSAHPPILSTVRGQYGVLWCETCNVYKEQLHRKKTTEILTG